MLDEGSGLARLKPVRRTPTERSAIVAKTYDPDATVAGVAHRHGIVASQLSSWRTVAQRNADRDNRRGSGFSEITMMANALLMPFDGIEVVCQRRTKIAPYAGEKVHHLAGAGRSKSAPPCWM
jgi:hypothetical protein